MTPQQRNLLKRLRDDAQKLAEEHKRNAEQSTGTARESMLWRAILIGERAEQTDLILRLLDME